MHADHGAMPASETHGFEQGAVVEHEDARIRHEQFEAGHAFAGHEGLHVRQGLVVDVKHDHVGADIDTGAGRASVPILQADQWTLAAGLVAKIDDRRRPPKRRRLRPRAKRVYRARHAKVPVQVSMHINATGQDEETAGVMRLNVLADDKPLANGMNPAILDEQVGLIIVHSRDNASVLDKDCRHRLSPRTGCLSIVLLVCNTLSLFQRQAQAGSSHAWLLSALMQEATLAAYTPAQHQPTITRRD